MNAKYILKQIPLLFFLSIALLSLNSCNKIEGHSVEGFVYAEGSDTLIVNARVILSESYQHNTAFLIHQTTTDANGYFKMKYHKRKFGYQYFLTSWTDKYKNGWEGEVNGSRHSKYTIYLKR